MYSGAGAEASLEIAIHGRDLVARRHRNHEEVNVEMGHVVHAVGDVPFGLK
jgi:hypothetical protein